MNIVTDPLVAVAEVTVVWSVVVAVNAEPLRLATYTSAVSVIGVLLSDSVTVEPSERACVPLTHAGAVELPHARLGEVKFAPGGVEGASRVRRGCVKIRHRQNGFAA